MGRARRHGPSLGGNAIKRTSEVIRRTFILHAASHPFKQKIAER
jgi:hypothetical protein